MLEFGATPNDSQSRVYVSGIFLTPAFPYNRLVKILLAPDSFKGSLSAIEVCQAMQTGWQTVFPESEVISIPLADGGEGTLDALLAGAGGTRRTIRVQGPLGEPVEADWGFLADGKAVIELAQASGLPLVSAEKRDGAAASTFGTGQLIKAALDAGCREFLVGIGGSATTDGGTGMLTALGAVFRDEHDVQLAPGGASLAKLASIDLRYLDPRLVKTTFTVLSDVTNPLCGPNGAAAIYGPQKGLTPDQVPQVDAALGRLADVAAAQLGKDVRELPGAGAAGGAGFGLLAFLNATLRPGIEMVLEATGFAEKLEGTDLVITGEGAIDEQTLSGKTIAGVCRVANPANVPVIAFGGAVRLSGAQLDSAGLAAAFSLVDGPRTLDYCVANGGSLLQSAVERAARLYRIKN